MRTLAAHKPAAAPRRGFAVIRSRSSSTSSCAMEKAISRVATPRRALTSPRTCWGRTGRFMPCATRKKATTGVSMASSNQRGPAVKSAGRMR